MSTTQPNLDPNPALNLDPNVSSYYTRIPETGRLDAVPFQLEGLRTRELIARFAPPPPAVVYDIGGGTGAYSFWLAQAGYSVHLIDPVPVHIAEAARLNQQAVHPLASCALGDARSLAAADSSADAVLFFGPLYHLTEPADRQSALAEALRILRPGGILFAAAITRYASMLDGLARELLLDPEFQAIAAQDLASGQHRNPTSNPNYFTTAYFHRPADLTAEIDAAGFASVAVYGLEGPAWILPDLDARLADPERRELLLRVARALESEAAMTAVSAHLLGVGRKPSGD